MDVDIDIKPGTSIEELFPEVIRASIVENGELKQHPVGYHFQTIATDRITGLAAIPFREAEEEGYNKIDFLNLHMLKIFDSKKEIRELLKHRPDWKLLQDDSVVPKLFHVAKHGMLLKQVKPESILELADVLALIRPGKTRLLDRYLENAQKTRAQLYRKDLMSDLRKSHAVAYAQLIVLQLHLIKAGAYETV